MAKELQVQTVNDFPYWSQVAYKDIDKNIMNAGCAPTAISMVLKALGKDVAPNMLCQKCKGHGWSSSSGASKEKLFPYIGKQFDVPVEQITSFSKCCELAKQGYPIVLDGQKDPGTTWHERCLRTCYGPAGHYVVLVAMSGNDVVINDPRGIFSSGIRPRSHASDGFVCGYKIGNKKFNLDASKFKKLGEGGGENGYNGSGESGDSNDSNSSGGTNLGTIGLTFNNTTTVQESLPNANVSDNWVDMHKIKGITLHMYPPYHDCTADSMAKYFKSLGWNRNFHYKVDKDTKINFSKAPVSGQTTGGNIVGSSVSDFEVKPKDPLYSGVNLGGGGDTGNSNNDNSEENSGSVSPIEGNDIPHKIYNYCVSQGCSMAAAAAIVGNCEGESSFNPACKTPNKFGNACGLFQFLDIYQPYKDLVKRAAAQNKKWSECPDIQIQIMWEQFSGGEDTCKSLLKKRVGGIEGFKKLTDPGKAAEEFGRCYERGGYYSKRRQLGEKWYKKFKEESGSNSSKTSTVSLTASAYKIDLNDEISLLNNEPIQNDPPFGWPVPCQTYVQSYFGYRTDSYGYNYHPGIDIVNYAGSGAYCYASGTVKTVLEDTKLNGYVRIDHGNGIETVYGSLEDIYVVKGDAVERGQCIGTTCSTASNPLMHLHFGMLIDGNYVDPLEYIEPGGGNSKIPEHYFGIATYDISNTSENVTWDNVDKGKICFASADNNTHTYIDANLFNNQHPKYTLSIGEFFYDEYDLVEKTGKVDYPKTEKKLIEQCAKALYDEGFTSKQLWREFDLNRAPSPFLYLDRDKWIAFCKEVDAQVKWLNTKYGKVTSTYVPNNLLTDQNSNQFIETAPDGGILNAGTNNGNNTENSGPADVKNALFIGDSWGVGIEKLLEAEGGTSEAESGKSFTYYYNETKKVDRLKGMKKDPSFIYVYLGYTNLKANLDNKYAEKFFERVAKLWPNTKVYVGKLIHAAKDYKCKEYKNSDAYNKALDKFNDKLSGICSKHSWNLIDVSSGLVDSNGYLDSKLCASNNITLKDYQKYYDNIKNAIGQYQNKSGNNNSDTKGSGNFIWPVPGTTRISSPFGPRKAPTAGASTYHRGIDIPASKGTKVIASDSGKVVVTKTGYNGGRGNYIVIDHGNGIGTLYQHLNKYVVSVGQSVKQGDKVAEVGNSGVGTGPHLHFEVQEKFSGTKGTPVNPENYVSPSKTKANSLTNDNATSNKSLYKVEDTEYGKVYTYTGSDTNLNEDDIAKQKTNEDIELFASSSALETNKGKYCYIGNTTENPTLYKDSKTSSSAVATLAAGDELLITGNKGAFYKCTFGKKTGYIPEENVVIIKKGHGNVNTGYVKANCWILYDNTDFYKKADLKSKYDDLKEQDKCVVLAVDKDKGLYKVETKDDTGWVKGYAVTFNFNEFKTAIDNTTNQLKESDTTTIGDSDKTLTDVDMSNGDFEDGNSNWSKQGNIEFDIIENPEWGTEGHWPYRGKKYARIRNVNDKLAGIKNKFSIDNTKNVYLRILFYVKQTTQDDFNNGPVNPKSIKSNGIYVKLLDKNNKVKHEKKISLSGISDTTWTRVGCVISNLSITDFTILIGNNKKFDLLIDDVTIEQINKKDIDNTTGDSNTTSGIDLSGLGTTSIDNGGVMIYTVGKPTNQAAKQPTIKTIITQKEYEEIMKYSTAANIDAYTNSFEPYDKDLKEAKTVGLSSDSRLETLTEKLATFTDNMIRYKVIETGPGSIDHCVKPVDELNVLYKNMECKVDPIYPDLVIPPKYTTSTYDSLSKNSIPLTTVEDASISLEDALDKSYSYDYKLLNKKTKKSSGKPVNYMDPYPYDDKITDLENHYPKVLIDEIESRLYSCNHPGCPIAHPMAKNFAMLNDMAINQSKMTEQRLVRIENILSTVTRYLGRMASRVNINCVYYGGQTVLGKYKCIRCLRDDRVHDGATVTMDQCLTCTRYEPIIGQIYDILDETGFNGSAILDDMQMSYMSLGDFKNLNNVEKRSSRYSYINTNKKEKNKPKSLIDEWQAADKKAKEKEIKKTVTNKKKQAEELSKLSPSDYLFMMDWTEESVDLQQPDVKVYPTEKIAAKYKNQKGDPGEDNVALAEKSTQMGTDKKTYNTIASGEWIDTREKDDSVQSNKYTSLDFYFENFNLNRTGYEYDNGIKGNVGLTYSGGSNSIDNSVNGNGAEIRKKITEMAQTIVKEYKDGKAKYSNSPRTIDHDKPQKCSDGKIGYDCTSFVSCCYKAAGLSDFYDGRTGQGSAGSNTLAQEVVKKGGKIWFADKDGMAKALPGDVLMTYGSAKIDKNKLSNGSGCKASHAIIYMGDGMIAHSSSPSSGIKYEKADYYVTGKHAGHSYFLRPQSLIDADKASSDNGGSGIDETAGEIDGVKYIMALKGSKCTQYKEGEGGYKDALGNRLYSSKCNTVASHNLPYGTKVYIPYFKGKQTANPSCIFTVTDTGNAGFDFDICCPASVYYGNKRMDVYVVSWGSGKGTAASVTYAYKHMSHSESMWRDYVKNGGTTYKVTKFCKDDVNITSQDFWTKYK